MIRPRQKPMSPGKHPGAVSSGSLSTPAYRRCNLQAIFGRTIQFAGLPDGDDHTIARPNFSVFGINCGLNRLLVKWRGPQPAFQRPPPASTPINGLAQNGCGSPLFSPLRQSRKDRSIWSDLRRPGNDFLIAPRRRALGPSRVTSSAAR